MLMKIRELEKQDAERMLEWMHDGFVVEKMHTDFATMTIEDCRNFIYSSCGSESVHFAIVNDKDKYMGTVSLKHITNKTAEFAIVLHREALGTGYAKWAMQKILVMAAERYKLDVVYWCVSKENLRALKFYDKNGYRRVTAKCLNIYGNYTKEEIESYIWYKVELLQNT